MSHHFKSLLQQLHPFFPTSYNTPKTLQTQTPLSKQRQTIAKIQDKSSKKRACNQSDNELSSHSSQSSSSSSDLDCKPSSILITPCTLKRKYSRSQQKQQQQQQQRLQSTSTTKKKRYSIGKDQMIDSGLETESSSNYYTKQVKKSSLNSSAILKSCSCVECSTRLARSNKILKKLRIAYLNYIKSNLNEQSFANIPMIIAKSFKSSETGVESPNICRIHVKKGSAVNALFLSENKKWIYVKTSNEVVGYIPKRCCEPFHGINSKCCSSNRQPKSKRSITFDYDDIKYTNQQLPPQMRPPPIPLSQVQSSKSKHHQSISQDHTYMTINDQQQMIKSKQEKKYEMFEDLENQTDLSLFSVSQTSGSPKLSPNQKKDILLLKTTKSRNRKLAVGLNTIPSSLTLTMIEQADQAAKQTTENYFNLADHQSNKKLSCYQDLTQFKSSCDECYDFLSTPSSSPLSNQSEKQYYDVLMTCKSKNLTNNKLVESVDDATNYYSNNTNQLFQKSVNNHLIRLKVIEDYEADFKDDLSVCKGDVVYLIESKNVDENSKLNNDWLFVRLYKRSIAHGNSKQSSAAKQQLIYENLTNEQQILSSMKGEKKLQGFIPRSCVAKI